MAPTLQTPPQSHYSSVKGGAVPPAIPSIRLISATPSTNGHDDSMTLASPPPPVPAMPWESTYPSANADPAPAQGSKTLRSVRSVLKPKSSGKENRTVVPKKSKLGLLGGLASNKDEKKAKDLSDVVRRMGISSASVSVNGVVVNQGSRSKTPSVASKDSQTLSLFRSSSNTSKEEKRASKTLKAQEKEAIKQNTLGKAGSVKLKGGFEIFVDPSYEDEEIGEILVVRKKKSRAGLDGVFGMDAVSKTGKSGTLGEITNGSARMRSESRGSVRGRTESAKYDKQDGGLLKPKEDDKKWWNLSIGRSRKDSKDERKEETVQDSVPMRSQTPDPFKPSSSEKESKAGRGRFNSLDAGMLLGLSSKKSNGDLDRAASPVPPPQRKGSMPMPSIIVAEPSPAERDFKATKYESMAPPPPMARSTSLPLGHDALLAYSAKASTPTTPTLLVPPTINGGLAPPVEEHMLGGKDNQGSIALRAMRSVRSFARIGAWASGDGANEEVKKDGTVKEKKSKSKSKKDKEAVEGDGTIRKKSKKDKKDSKKEKAKGDEEKEVKTKESAVRLSTSSFEAGALTSSPAPPPRSQSSLGIYGHKSSTRNDATVNSAFLSASNAYPEFDASTKQDKYASVGYGYDKNAAIGFDANTGNLTIGKSKGKKSKKEKADKAKSSDETTGNKDTISKKHSILGLGLPSSMRLGGRGRQGSSASSLFNPASDKVEGGKQFGATIIPPAFSTRLSVDSCAPAERRASINSTTSSLRPISVTSSISGASTADSRRVSESSSLGVGSILAGRQHRASTQSKKSTGAGSIRWDDGVLEREKEKVRRESLESTMRRESMDSRRASGESTRRSSLDPKQKEEARRRTALGDVFPELASAPGSRRTSGVSEDGATSKRSSRSSTSRDGRFKYPILTIEEATNDGHSVDDRSLHGYDRGSSGDYEYAFNSGQATFGAYDETRVEGDEIRAATSLGFAPADTSVDTLSTPLKKARQRPRSEQLLGGFGKSRSLGPADVLGMGSSRPGALYEDDDGVLSVLSAATNDLEKLINVLDLQATPCTPDLTPLKPSLSPYSSEPSSVVSNRLLNASLVSMDRVSSIASLRAFAAASASKMPSSFKKESDTRTQSNKTKSNSKSLSKSKQIKALCNASPTAKKSTGVNSVLSLGSTNAANTATIRASGGVKAMVARLNEQSSQSQLSSLFNHGTQRKTSTSSQLTCRSSVSSLNSVAGSVRLGPYKQSRKLSGGPAGGLAGLFGGGSTTNMSKVEEGSLEVDEDDIVAEVMKAAESKVKRDEEEKRKVDEKKKAEEAERQKAVEEESEKSRSPSMFARKHKHKRTMTPGPEPEPAPVFQPLQLPRRKNQGALPVQKEQNLLSVRPLAIRKLSKESPIRLKDAFCDDSGDENGQSDLFGTIRASKDNKRSSTSRLAAALRPEEVEHKSPITKEARRMLGRSLGGSDVSAYQVEVDESDPDSDVPEELRVILRKDDRAVKAYGTGRNARVFEQEEDVYSDEEDSRPHHRDEEEDDFDNDGEGYTVNHDDMTLDVTTDEWSVEVPRSAPAVFTQQPVFSASHLGVAPTGSPLASSVGLGNSVGLSSSMASVATVRQASIQRLPVFRAQLVPDTVITAPSSAPASTTTYPAHQLTSVKHLSASCSSSSSDGHGNDLENTKTSFDFTGEYARLNQSGDRLSFVEQLESAFKTPAKVDLDFNSDMFKIGFGIEDAPPVPDLPKSLRRIVEDESSVEDSVEGSMEGSMEESVEDSMEAFKLRIGSRQVTNATFLSVANESVNVSQAHTSGFLADDDYSAETQADLSISELTVPVLAPRSSSTNIRKQPSRLEALKSSNSTLEVNDSNLKSSTRSKSNSISSSRSRASDGELNRSFRFGGFSSSQGSSSSPVEQAEAEGHLDSKIELTLSDIIPSPRHAREISFHSSMLDDYEDSGLKSMLSKEDELPVKELPPLPASIAPQAMNNSDDVFSDSSRETKRISFVPLTRPSSNVSFAGMDSFDEVRRGFEFHDYRPAFYPAEATALPTGPSGGRYSHRKAQDSVWSIASVSSYGHVLRDGAADPFDYGVAPPVPALPEHLRQHNRMISEAVSMEGSMEGTDYTDSMSFEMSTNVDDTFSFIKNRPVGYGRRRVDSDASSFYFTHRRRESNWSVSSIPGIPGMPPPPPISMFTRGHHRKTSSVTSASSIALSYAMHGAMGGRAILARHRRETSTDSMMEEDHSMHRRSFARPGLGDKMFETSANYLDAIAGSPSGSIDLNHLNSADQTSNRDSEGSFDYYDSILDNTQQEHAGRLIVSSYEQPSISVVEDSLFDKSGVRSEVSGDCVFGDSNSNADRARRLPNAQFRPLSLISNQSVHDSMHEDDTMISMIGGGHVRRLSVGSQIEASPCVRIEKRRPRQRHRATARMVYQGTQLVRIDANGNEVRDSKAGGKLHNIVEKPSIASTSSMTFGDNRMGNARRGLLERQSLEASCLVAKGEDNSLSYEAVPVFTRPMPAGRQRSSTQSSCTTSSESSSGIDTPPLSPSDGSMSGGSMSSIDLLDLGSMLVNTTNPVSSLAAARTRAIANGTGHRRRYSHAQRMSISRASHYETIEEESNASSSECDTPNRSLAASVTKKLDSSINEEPTAIYVVDSDSQSIISVDQETSWDDERGIMAMRKFYTLKDEAHVTVEESRRQWEDTPFSVYALQTFDPPRNPDGMKALLEQSVRTYIPLPAELRRMRSRKGSRPSPYPQTRTFKTSTTSINSPPIIAMPSPASFKAKATGAGTPLKQRSINTLGVSPAPALPQFKLGNLKPMSPFTVRVNDSPLKENKKKMSNGSGDGSFVRPRVPSAVRRSALGWTKRSNGPKNSMENKENAGQGLASTPGDNLRINRPRPRGRTPGSQARPIRV